jgi:hypothetical protein
MSLTRKVIQNHSCALVIACGLGCLSCGDCVERPSIVSIHPANAAAGTPGPVLTFNGNDFQRNSTIEWNDTACATTFVSSHQLRATIPTSDVAMPATVKVTVFSPSHVQPITFGTTNSGSSAGASFNANCAGGTSNSRTFVVNHDAQARLVAP